MLGCDLSRGEDLVCKRGYVVAPIFPNFHPSLVEVAKEVSQVPVNTRKALLHDWFVIDVPVGGRSSFRV